MSASPTGAQASPPGAPTGRAVGAEVADRSDWNALLRMADGVGTQANPVTQIRGRHPLQFVVDNGGAQAVCSHDDDFEGVITSDGARHEFVTY